MPVKITESGDAFDGIFLPTYPSFSNFGAAIHAILSAENTNVDILLRAFTEAEQSKFVGADQFAVHELNRALTEDDLAASSSTPYFLIELNFGSFNSMGEYEEGEIEGEMAPEPASDSLTFFNAAGAYTGSSIFLSPYDTATDIESAIGYAVSPDSSNTVVIQPDLKSFKLTFNNPEKDILNIDVSYGKRCPRLGGDIPGAVETWAGPRTKRASYLLERTDDEQFSLGPLQSIEGEPVSMTITELGEALSILGKLTWNEKADLVLSQSLNLFAVFEPGSIGDGKTINIGTTLAGKMTNQVATQFME